MFVQQFRAICEAFHFFVSVYIVNEPLHQFVHSYRHVVLIVTHQLLVFSKSQQTAFDFYKINQLIHNNLPLRAELEDATILN